jgi:hypothetical protein
MVRLAPATELELLLMEIMKVQQMGRWLADGEERDLD